MAVLVTEAGFGVDDWSGEILSLEALAATPEPEQGLAVDLPNDRDPAVLVPWLDRLALVRVAFPVMGDGRGYSIGRQLRMLGYRGRLRAAGPLIADQFRFARRVGFDEIELPDAVAERQPEAQWQIRSQGSYQDRLLA